MAGMLSCLISLSLIVPAVGNHRDKSLVRSKRVYFLYRGDLMNILFAGENYTMDTDANNFTKWKDPE